MSLSITDSGKKSVQSAAFRESIADICRNADREGASEQAKCSRCLMWTAMLLAADDMGFIRATDEELHRFVNENLEYCKAVVLAAMQEIQ